MPILWRGYFLLWSIPPPVIIIWWHIMFDPHKMQNETDASHDYVASMYIVQAFFINLFGCHHALTELCRLFAIGYFFIVYILLKDFLMNSQNFIFIDTFMDIYNFTITAFSNFPNYGIWWGDAIAHSHRNLFGIHKLLSSFEFLYSSSFCWGSSTIRINTMQTFNNLHNYRMGETAGMSNSHYSW